MVVIEETAGLLDVGLVFGELLDAVVAHVDVSCRFVLNLFHFLLWNSQHLRSRCMIVDIVLLTHVIFAIDSCHSV